MHRTLVSVITVAILSLAACAPGDDGGDASSPQAGEPVKVGVILPLTGSLAQTGAQNLAGIKFGVDKINEAGGIESLDGAEIELVVEDNANLPEKGTTAANRLVTQENVSAIIGSYSSSTTLPLAAELERLEVPLIASTAIADDITDSGYTHVVRIPAKASWLARDMVSFLTNDMANAFGDIKTAGLIYEDGDFGQATADGLKTYLDEAGIEVVADVSYPTGAATLASQMNRIDDANPDAVITATYVSDTILITREKERLGMEQPFLEAAGGTTDPTFIENLKDQADGWLTAMEWHKDIPGQQELNDEFFGAYGYQMNGENANNVQAVMVLRAALEAAGSSDPAEVNSALHAVEIVADDPDLVLVHHGEINFDDTGQNEGARFVFAQIKDQKYNLIGPEEVAVDELDSSL